MKKYFFAAAVISAGACLLLWLRAPHQSERVISEPVNAVALEQSLPPFARPTLRPELLGRLSPEVAVFRRWSAEYASAASDVRDAMLEDGKKLANAHRERIKALISGDPRRALEEALPAALRQDLPAEIVTILEERVNAKGFYGVLARAPGTNGTPAIQRVFTPAEGRRYEASVYGRRVRQTTTAAAILHGVAVDGVLAVHEDPVRPMESGERPRPGQPVVYTCPVSGRDTVLPDMIVSAEFPAVEVAGEVRVLCSGGHIHALRERIVAAEGATGGPSMPTGPVDPEWSTGAKSLLYIRATFPDQSTDPQTEKEAYDMMKQVNDFFMENSHGRLHLLTTVTPLLTMPKPDVWYRANDTAGADFLLSDARNTARAAGFDDASYDLFAVRYNGASGAFSGQAFVGGAGCWLKSGSVGVAAHELGHNMGMWHANYWNTGGESVVGPGSNIEYGNPFDTMAVPFAGNYFFNAGHQMKIRWLPDENVAHVTQNGVYRIFQQDQARIDPACRYLLTVTRDSQRDYWCEFRQKLTTNPWLMSGLQLSWSPWGDDSSGAAYGSNGGSQLLDATPGSPDGRNDCALTPGRTFSDIGAQLHITAVGKGATVPESIDVVVNRGAFLGNQAPTLSLAAVSLTAAPSEPLTFNATAMDPDGDPLAYAWDWGDRTFGANAAVAVKSWSAPGKYTVRCEVSDMRGGTRSALLPVAIGATEQFSVSGRVLTSDESPVAGVRVHNGLNGEGYRGCLTDSGGNYVLSGLEPGAYTLSAVVVTHTCNAGFANPVVIVNMDVTGADFTAAAKTVVSISVPEAACTEGGQNAKVRFSRLAPANEGAVAVRVFIGGSADLQDLEFAPEEIYQTGTYIFTIPDGQPWLDVAVTAFDDDDAEGEEELAISLVAGSDYIPFGPESVAVAVNDNDTTLPVVSAEAIDGSATEGGDGAIVRLSRTGPVNAALTVSLSRTGNATAGADYSGINAVATIPAGESFVDLALTPFQDTSAEGSESAIFRISSTASWIASSLRNTASVVILDDDTPVVTIAAADSAAAETDNDPAVFILTRTGDLGSPLDVDYALGGTAQHGTDYQPLSGRVTIPAGLANAALVITPVDDAIGELPQTVSVQLRSAARYLPGIPFSASATIADNDSPHILVSVSDGNCNEAGGVGKFKIQSYASGIGDTTVHYQISGTAVSGVDFATVPGFALVPRSGYVEVNITPLQDTEWEDAESIVLTLLPDAAYSLSSEIKAVFFLTDHDQPLVSVTASQESHAEDNSAAVFYFSRTGATSGPLAVTYAISGMATGGADYVVPSGTLTIPAEATGASLEITLLDDALPEGAESLVCTVSSSPGVYGLRTGSATIYLTDTDSTGLPTVSFAASNSTHAEDAGSVEIPVALSVPSAEEIRVDYAIQSGLAFNGVDYIARGGTLVFAPGETTQSISALLLDDAFQEPAETCVLRLRRASAARIVSPASHAIKIADNDATPPPVIGFATPASTAGEGVGTPPLTLVFLDSPQLLPVSVNWTLTGGTASAGDVTALSGTLTFFPGETAKPVPLALIDDTIQESSETLVISLSAPSAPARLAPFVTHTLTLSDNDDTSITIAATVGAAEEGREAGQFTVSRVSMDLSVPVAVSLVAGGTANGGEDFAILPATIVIPAGERTAAIPVVPFDDALFDPAETVVLIIGPSPFYTTGSPSAATISIADNETGVAIAATDSEASEPSGQGGFTITRTGPLLPGLTVNLVMGGTATPGSDFEALPASVTFASGQASLPVIITPLDDHTAEPDELVSLAIGPGGGYLIVGSGSTVTINDDDENLPPQVTIDSPSNSSVFVPAGTGLMLRAGVADDERPYPPVPLSIQWSVINGSGAVTFGDSTVVGTTAQFDAPGQYHLRLTATDRELASHADLSVFILGDTLTGTDVGTTGGLTGLAGGGNSWTLTGSGSGLATATADGCYFAHRMMAGDFSIVTRVAGISPPNVGISARCGVMVRSALTQSAAHASMTVSQGRSSFVWRATENSNGFADSTNQTNLLPCYVRLERTGNVFSAAHSADGSKWTIEGSPQTIAMPDPVYAGLVATSGSTATSVIASVDAFSLTRFGNTAPFVDAGFGQTTGMRAMLSGIVIDEAAPQFRWEKLSGPGGVALPASPSGTAIFEAPGTYTLRLSASDGEVDTFDDTVVTVIPPFAEWRARHFQGTAGDPLIAGPRADPDNDGLENLAEYVLDSNPAVPASDAAPVASRTAGTLSMVWRQATAATDVIIEPQWSGDMLGWDSSALVVETLTTDPEWIEKRATLDISNRPRAGLRLRVTLP